MLPSRVPSRALSPRSLQLGPPGSARWLVRGQWRSVEDGRRRGHMGVGGHLGHSLIAGGGDSLPPPPSLLPSSDVKAGGLLPKVLPREGGPQALFLPSSWFSL